MSSVNSVIMPMPKPATWVEAQAQFGALVLLVALATVLTQQPPDVFKHVDNAYLLAKASDIPYFNAPRAVFARFFEEHKNEVCQYRKLAIQFTLLLYSLGPARHAFWWSLAWHMIDDEHQVFVEATANAITLVPRDASRLKLTIDAWIENLGELKGNLGALRYDGSRLKVDDGDELWLDRRPLVQGFVTGDKIIPIPDDTNTPASRASNISFVIKRVCAAGAVGATFDETRKLMHELLVHGLMTTHRAPDTLVSARLVQCELSSQLFLVSRFKDSDRWYRLAWKIDRHHLSDTVFEDVFALPVALGLFGGLAWLHSHRTLHGDICARNIVVDEQLRTRLIDFDRSVCVDTACGGAGIFARSEFGAAMVVPHDLRLHNVHWYSVPEMVDDPFVCDFFSDLYPAVAIVTLICFGSRLAIEQGVAPHLLRNNAAAIASAWGAPASAVLFARSPMLRKLFAAIARRDGQKQQSAADVVRALDEVRALYADSTAL
jgi:hypothetical protein